MDTFDDSFNIFFGLNNDKIELDNNPYIEFNVYDITNEYKPNKSENIKLKKCGKKDFAPFVSEQVS